MTVNNLSIEVGRLVLSANLKKNEIKRNECTDIYPYHIIKSINIIQFFLGYCIGLVVLGLATLIAKGIVINKRFKASAPARKWKYYQRWICVAEFLAPAIVSIITYSFLAEFFLVKTMRL